MSCRTAVVDELTKKYINGRESLELSRRDELKLMVPLGGGEDCEPALRRAALSRLEA